MARMISSTEIYGERLLREMDAEEESLEDLLTTFRQIVNSDPQSNLRSLTGLPALDALWFQHLNQKTRQESHQNQIQNQHHVKATTSTSTISSSGPPPTLSLTGDSTALINHILTHLLSTLQGSVALLDLTGRFSVSQLYHQHHHQAHPQPQLLPRDRPLDHDQEHGQDQDASTHANRRSKLTRSDLAHLHIFHPTPTSLPATLQNLERYMLYGEHPSHHREWLGVLILGAAASPSIPPSPRLKAPGSSRAGHDRLYLTTAHRAWLHVAREQVTPFAERLAVQEIWAERERRQEMVEAAGRAWVGRCEEGLVRLSL